MTGEEQRLRRARKARATADAQYREAVAACLAAGMSYADVARIAGVSRQAVRTMVKREETRQ